MSVRNCLYSPNTAGSEKSTPLWSRCHASILLWRSSRTASSSRLRGARSLMTAAAPFQKVSLSTPVPGSASLLMKS
ncbi:Uncharacterised protein [Mycobacteroides abscessus subsp. abscessus]|nr:Uncharacterised protein [Mycobacteroides abscessus subsp. abscessus]